MLSFLPSDVVLCAVQASVVALPAAGAPAWQRRLRGRGWALVPPLSIVVVIVAIGLAPHVANGLTYLALVTTPPLAALALGWAMHRARPAAALAVLPLLAIAWAGHGTLAGQAGALVLTVLGCVTLGRLLCAVSPLGWLKLGIGAMAAIDTALIVARLLQHPNSVLNAASPVAHLPRFQVVGFGDALMGYGDVFVAGVLGAILAAEGRRQAPSALLVLVLALAFDLLFLLTDELPATVPVALALGLGELWRRRGSLRAAPAVSASATGAGTAGTRRTGPTRPARRGPA